MNQPAQQPTPDEVAQIVITTDVGGGARVISRFRTLKKAERELAKLLKAWGNCIGVKDIYYIDGDMWGDHIDLSHVVGASLIDWKKRDKFIPR